MNPSIFIWQSVALPWHIDYIGYALLFMTFGYVYKNNQMLLLKLLG